MVSSCNTYIFLQLWEAKLDNMKVGEEQGSTVNGASAIKDEEYGVSFQRAGVMGNAQIRLGGMEKSISPILFASASTKISHDFASPEIMTLFSCIHVN